MDNLGGALIILGILVLVLYFLPTILSLILRRRNTLAIFAMNLLLGWTLIGWVAALVWALTKDNQNQTVIIKNEIKTDSKMVTIDKSLDDPHTEKIDDTNNTETSTADKSTIGTVENNSNRKKVLNILLFVSFLWGAFLVGFFVDHYFNRDKGVQNQSKNIPIVSNQSNSSDSTMNSNSTNEDSEWVCVSNDTNNCDIYYNPNRIAYVIDTLPGELLGYKNIRVWLKFTGQDAKDSAIKFGAERNMPAERYNNWAKTLILYEFDCQIGDMRWVANLSYDTNGRIIYSDRRGGRWNDIVPDSFLDNLRKIVCRDNKQENNKQENNIQENNIQEN
jgi:hypothetical protein